MTARWLRVAAYIARRWPLFQGVSAVNALSDWLELEIRRGGKVEL